MSAHLRSIVQKCQWCRDRQATVQLYSTRNAGMGVYCRKDGLAALPRVLQKEVEFDGLPAEEIPRLMELAKGV